MIVDEKKECLIWPSSKAVSVLSDAPGIICIASSRAGGKYQLSEQAWFRLGDLSVAEKARLTTLLVDRRIQGDSEPPVTVSSTDRALSIDPLEVSERAKRLLRFVAWTSNHPGDGVNLRDHSQNSEILDYAMAWTESTTLEEVRYFRDYLLESGWLREIGNYHYAVSVDGYNRISELKTNADSSQAFVAMWFDGEMEEVYDRGIVPAVLQAGFKPMRIDRKKDVVKIDDEIIAEIRKSRFLVADFTHGDEGARGGVYFEAGFAFGLGLPVIHTCRADMVGKIHFDTRQHFHTIWETPDDLRVSLTNRIVARIGMGPNRPPS